MITTDKIPCRILVDVLAAHGVKDVVISPGSRNTPLIIAAARKKGLVTHVVIDERCAAFFGLGIALSSHRPTALICTSGSAVLNYGPALAEAFYRHFPLVAISADRPTEWIDQDDSQTIRQAGILDSIVKASFDLSGENGSDIQLRHFSRTVNDALITAKREPQGPVHLNIRLDEPLGSLSDSDIKETQFIECTSTSENLGLTQDQIDVFADAITGKKVILIAGFGSPSTGLESEIGRFIAESGAVFLYEAQSNIHVNDSIGNIDATLSSCSLEDYNRLKPDIAISFGGSLVSRMVKRFLRNTDKLEHWHIGKSENSIDCFTSLRHRIECDPAVFFRQLAGGLAKRNRYHDVSYRQLWLAKSNEAADRVTDFTNNAPWSDFKAMGLIMNMIPTDWNIHLSNGTAIRYAQLFDYSTIRNIECNRGVSGIDGSTSTAIGSHVCYNGTTLLISGDMSAQYDIGSLALTQISPRFKMIVLNNNGGGIFRFIKSTSGLDELEQYFAVSTNLPLRQLADAYGFSYYEAHDSESLTEGFRQFADECSRPAILNVITPPTESAEILKQFFKTT